MRKGGKCGGFANRNCIHQKRAKYSQRREKNALFLLYSHFMHEKRTRKSPLFLDKNRFANHCLYHVYYASEVAKNNASRSPGKGLFRRPRRNTPPFFSLCRDCRGIGPIEGTEMLDREDITANSADKIAEALAR